MRAMTESYKREIAAPRHPLTADEDDEQGGAQ